jgi:hypothetical protein
MNARKNQNIEIERKKGKTVSKTLLRRFLGFAGAGLLLAASLAAGLQNMDELTGYFQEHGVPVQAVNSENGTVIAEIRLAESDDIRPQKMEENNVLVFSKLAETYPDSSIIRLEYSMEGKVFNILEIDTPDIKRAIGTGQTEAAMLAHARMSVTPSLQQEISSGLEATQARDEAAEPREESGLPERTVDLPDEEGFSGGGGGGGMAIKTSGLSGTVIILFVFLAASLALAMGIWAVRSRPRASSQNIRARLKVFYSDGGSKVFPLAKRITSIGRGTSNDLVLNDAQVSTRHAEIVVSEQTFLLRDLQSSNGTWLNGKKIAESPLYLGDEILLGSTRLIFSD